jgi:hypothetical protein
VLGIVWWICPQHKIHQATIGEEMANTRRAKQEALDDELAGNDFIEVEILGTTYRLRRKFKRLKFLRLLTADPPAALRLVFADGEYERLEDVDMGDGDMEAVFELISSRLVGGPKG